MTPQSNALGVFCLVFCSALGAQPNRVVEAYGDPARGHFGDPGQGHFGDPSQGQFRRHNFSRDQEGTVPVLKGMPIERFVEIPPPPPQSATTPAARRGDAVDAPYVTLTRPLDDPN